MLRDGENLDIQEPIFWMCIKASQKIRLFPVAMSVCHSVFIYQFENYRTDFHGTWHSRVSLKSVEVFWFRFKSTKYFDIFIPIVYLYVTVPCNNRIAIFWTLLAYPKSAFRSKNRPEKLVVVCVGKTSSNLNLKVGSVPCRQLANQPDRQTDSHWSKYSATSIHSSFLPSPHTLHIYILRSILVLLSHDHHTKK